jgi:predicted RNA-binding Zn-ribbon protein involved in translation (DUF1610 family)
LHASAREPTELASELECPLCGARMPLRCDHVTADGGLEGCLACGHIELYTRKSFPTIVGFAIVAIAAVLAPWTHYVSLLVAALLDLALYRLLSDVIVCYVCASEHRGFAPKPAHPRFDREIAERLKFGPRAVMCKPMREAGTADAPEPEH